MLPFVKNQQKAGGKKAIIHCTYNVEVAQPNPNPIPPSTHFPPPSSFIFLCVATVFVLISCFVLGTKRRIRDLLQLRRVCVTSEFPSEK